jgi:hypothetical protein
MNKVFLATKEPMEPFSSTKYFVGIFREYSRFRLNILQYNEEVVLQLFFNEKLIIEKELGRAHESLKIIKDIDNKASIKEFLKFFMEEDLAENLLKMDVDEFLVRVALTN